MRQSLRDTTRLADMPFEEHPRERLLGHGPVGLRDAELIALVLRTGAPGVDAIALAERLLGRYGGLLGVLGQDGNTLREVTGLGAAKAAALVAVRELATRMALASVPRGPYLNSTSAVRRYLKWRLGGLEREVFGLVLLNARHHVLGIEYLFYGSVDRSAVYTREIIKCCMRRNAAAVVLFHNHPSGDIHPSQLDKALTTRVTTLLDEIEVQVIDHMIIGDVAVASMAELGMLPPAFANTAG